MRPQLLHPALERLRRIGGVALLSLRASLRTKVVASLLALLAVCVALLPKVVKGDGTPEGELHILLSYTLGFSFGLLCLATLWSACALFAAEIDSLRMQLSAVKPVRPAEFWAGKWFALLALNAVLLAAVYAGVYAQVQWRLQRSGWAEEERPASRRVTRPILPSVEEEARQTYEAMRREKALPEGMSERAVLRVLAERAPDKYDVVNPGEVVRWRFGLARPVAVGEAVTVRIKFDTEYSARTQVRGTCRLACSDLPGREVQVELDDFTQSEIEFSVDTRAFVEQGQAVQGAGSGPLRRFELVFQHTGDPKRSPALMLRFRQDVVLLTAGGTFEANLTRAALLQGCVLALLAAFGLTLSACFTLPVAAFVSTVLLVLTMVGNSVVQVVAQEDEAVLWNRPGIWVSRAVHEATRHAVKEEPLTALTRGERIDGAALGASVLWNVVLVPGVFAMLGCVVLRRRELAAGD